MSHILSAPSSGARAPSNTLRLLAALLTSLLLAAPVAAVAADPAPRIAHADHIGTAGESGCETFHDGTYCLTCRVFSTPPLASPSSLPLPLLSLDATAWLADPSRTTRGAPSAAPLRPRAPPRT